MSVRFINWSSRVAIAGRVAEWRRLLNGSSELMVRGDYHLPFGRDEARSEAAKWLWPATAL